MDRRWQNGARHVSTEGLHFQVRHGSKKPGDLVMDVWNGQRWYPVRMSTVFMLTDFLFENEHVIFPCPPYEGGYKFLKALRVAGEQGWEEANRRLEAEKTAKCAVEVPREPGQQTNEQWLQEYES